MRTDRQTDRYDEGNSSFSQFLRTRPKKRRCSVYTLQGTCFYRREKRIFFILTLTLLTWTKWRAPTSYSKWRMGFNSAFKGLIHILLTWTKWRAPASASKWRMRFNSVFKGLINTYSNLHKFPPPKKKITLVLWIFYIMCFCFM
jgi:hypothetical protein